MHEPTMPIRHGRLGRPFIAAVVATFLLVPAAFATPPSESGVVERFRDVAVVSYFDQDSGLIALGGPEPAQGCLGEGFDAFEADFMAVHTAAGPIHILIKQVDLPIYVFNMSIEEICEIVIGGGSVEPLYSGTVRSIGTDNDVDVSLTRTNSFGASSHGTVWDADGNACQLNAHIRLQISRDGEFRILTEQLTIAC